MQLQLLSSMFGSASARPGMPGGLEGAGDAGLPDGFARMLAAMPGQVAPSALPATVASSAPADSAAAVAPVVTIMPKPVALANAHASAALELPVAAVALPQGLTGNPVPQTGKDLPVVPLAAQTQLPISAKAAALVHHPVKSAAKDHELAVPARTGDDPAPPAAPRLEDMPAPVAPAQLAEAPPAEPAFADMALLQGWATQYADLLAAPAKVVPASARGAALVAIPDHQVVATAAMAMPQVTNQTGGAKDRPMRSFVPASEPTPAPEATVVTSSPAHAPEISLPLTRTGTPRPHEPAGAVVQPAAVLQPVATLAEQPAQGAEAAPGPASFDQPATPDAELGAVIDRLVESRIQAREGKSEINLPHPDFGKVTLALSLGGQDRLSVAMPDAPGELRAAVSQAFAPAPRSETPVSATPAAADGALSGGADARTSDPRREQQQQASSSRGDPSRADNTNGHQRQSATNRENARAASGRGVLA